MARRLTTFSKFLITLLIIAGLFFLIRFVLNQTDLGGQLKQQSEDYAEKSDSKATADNASTSNASNKSFDDDDDDVMT